MERFQYRAKSKEGKLHKGKIEARDIKQAASILRERDLVVVGLRPARRVIKLDFLSSIFRRVKFVEIVNFTRQMSTMITAGLPLTEALALLETQSSTSLQPIVSQVLRDIEGGKPLGDGLEKHPKVFSSVYVALVRAGEAAGKLDEMLKRLADNLEKEREFRSKTKGALMYPLIVMVGMSIVALIMMFVVVPQMTSIYEDFGSELPFSTQLLVASSNFLISYWYVGIIGFFVSGWLFRAWRATPVGRRTWDLITIKIPLFGKLKEQVLLAEFCRTLGLLISAGVSIVEALTIVSDAVNNVVYENSIKETANRVEKGISVAATMATYEHFPAILPQMLAVGEETGKVDEVLLKLAVYFESESENMIKGLTTAIEPLIMVFLGIGVGFMVLSIIMPIYKLTSEL